MKYEIVFIIVDFPDLIKGITACSMLVVDQRGLKSVSMLKSQCELPIEVTKNASKPL